MKRNTPLFTKRSTGQKKFKRVATFALNGKTHAMEKVLILGALSDMAEAIVYAYAERGADLVLAARNPSRLDRVAADLEIRFGKRPTIAEFDAEKPETHIPFYNALPFPPDVVVCAFGYLGEQQKAFHNFKEADRIIMVNYTGAVSVLNLAAADMEKRKAGLIIGISSVAGERGRQSNFIYGSAKAGFSTYLAGLRNYLFHHGVHVLTVKPGFAHTKMTEGLALNPALTAIPKQIARDVLKAADKKKNVLYTLWMWRYIMCIIRAVPEPVFKKLRM
jgi:short-subunit dehydrogenase